MQFKWYLDDLQTFDGVTNADDEKSSVLELKDLGKTSNGKVSKYRRNIFIRMLRATRW